MNTATTSRNFDNHTMFIGNNLHAQRGFHPEPGFQRWQILFAL